MNKAVEHLTALRDKLAAVDDSYLDTQQDILETFVDRGHLQRSRRYRLPAQEYSVCLVFLKLFDRVYAPSTAGLLEPIPGDTALPNPSGPASIASTSASATALTACSALLALLPPHPSTRTKFPLMPP